MHNYVAPYTEISGYFVRQNIVSFIRSNTQVKSTIAERLSGVTVDEYLQNMENSTTWADENVFYAASELYNLQIRIWTCDREQNIVFGSPVAGRSIDLGFVTHVIGVAPNHYVSLIPSAGWKFY
jgi:hypothetical protein